tara:strand:- start:1378 stop:2031 length:654 start_codon:yes stop_codon:yes gene_type:complete
MSIKDEEAISFELNDSESLFVFFGGISGGLYLPKFEFYKSSGVLDASRVFIRDMNQAWYHKGLKDDGNIEQFIEEIGKICSLRSFDKITFVGNSMGGYAALLSQLVLGVGRAVAFNPQTFISSDLRLEHKDFRWEAQIKKVKNIIESSPYKDLKTIVEDTNRTNCEIHVAKDDLLDLKHAWNLANYNSISIIEHESGGHNLVGSLRDSDQLLKIVQG